MTLNITTCVFVLPISRSGVFGFQAPISMVCCFTVHFVGSGSLYIPDKVMKTTLNTNKPTYQISAAITRFSSNWLNRIVHVLLPSFLKLGTRKYNIKAVYFYLVVVSIYHIFTMTSVLISFLEQYKKFGQTSVYLMTEIIPLSITGSNIR